MRKTGLVVGAVSLVLLVSYALAGFYLLPKWLRDNGPALLTAQTGQPVQLQAAHFNPFTFKAQLQGLDLQGIDGKSLLRFKLLSVDVDVLQSLQQRALIISAIDWLEPVIELQRLADGRFNFQALLEASAKAPAESAAESAATPTLPISIQRVSISQGWVGWRDLTLGEQARDALKELNVTVADFSTRPDSQAAFDWRWAFESGGSVEGQGIFNLSGPAVEGHVALDSLSLPKAWQLFLQTLSPLEITDGMLSLQADYQIDFKQTKGPSVRLQHGGLVFKQLELKEKNQAAALIQVPPLEAAGIDLDLNAQRLEMASITGRDANLKAWLQPDGQLNYQALFSPESDATNPAPQPEPAAVDKPWQITLKGLKLDNYQIAFSDQTQSKPVDVLLDQISVGVQDYQITDGVKFPLQLSTRLNQFGHLKLTGDMVLSPLTINLAVDLQGIKLKPFQTYVDSFVNLELADGELATQGQLQFMEGEPVKLSYVGSANIDHLITRDKVKNLDFVKWADLALEQMELDVGQQRFTLGKVSFDRPYVRFTINKDRSNNVSDILAVKPQTASAEKPVKPSRDAARTAHEPSVSIGKIELKQGQSDFADYSLILPFVVKMNELNGEVDRFASNSDDAATLKLQGKVRDLATVKIAGKYQFQSGNSDIALSFKHLPLPIVTPYMAEFAGYRIEKGQMALDLNYTIKDKDLVAQNKILIDQLELGEKVENPKAVSLPLELGVALLKDGDGKIKLDFPVTGSLEDPQFSVGSLVTDVLVNVITKAVTSPFKALAGLFDSDADFSLVAFAAGSTELTAETTGKLDQIGKVLSTKPELVLEIKGMAYQQQDWPVLRSEALLDILKKMKSGELRDKGEKIRSEYIELPEDEYKRLLAKFYAEVFPQKLERSVLGRPKIKDQPEADFYSVARAELEAIMQPDPQRLNELAVSRANLIAKYLHENGLVDKNRIYILATEVKEQTGEDGNSTHLSLNVPS